MNETLEQKRSVNAEDSILLSSGAYYSFTSPETSPLFIEDLARGLANQGRFNGQTKKFYSIAQHCVFVSHLVPSWHAFAGLMHDAHEALIGDIVTPLKRLLPDFRNIERRVEADVLRRFGLALPLHPSVKLADRIALATERRDFLPADAEEWEVLRGIEPHPATITPWPPESAFMMFMQRFQEIRRHPELYGNYVP